MNMGWYRRIGGGALLFSGVGMAALCLLGLLSYLFLVAYPASSALAGYQLAGVALFIAGVPVIQLSQPGARRLGWLGIVASLFGMLGGIAVVAYGWGSMQRVAGAPVRARPA